MTERSASQRKRRPERVLTDPRAIKALAHPARLAALEALGDDDSELTATECAELAGVSPSAMSYHLRALEKWGFVERSATSSDGRERPWRASTGGWRVDDMPDEVTAAATSAVTATILDQIRADASRWFDRERSQPSAWRHAAMMQSRPVWLTADEAVELEGIYNDFIDQRRGRTAQDHPEGARRVRSTRILVPLQYD